MDGLKDRRRLRDRAEPDSSIRGSWTRRSILRAAAQAGAGLALSRPAWAAHAQGLLGRSQRPGRVLVLGAGLAGLAAGWELLEAGHDVTILEAQARSGGRVLTLREPFSDGLYAEAGGMAFNPRYRHFQRYLGLFGLKASAPRWDESLGTVYHLRGQRLVVRPEAAEPVRWPYRLDDAERGLGPGGLIARYLGDVVEGFGDPTAPDWRIEPLLRYDELTFGDFLRSRGASDEAVALIRDTTWFGGGIERSSALSTLVADFALFHDAGPFQVIDGGNDQLPRAMAQALRHRIQYGAPVRAIVAGDSGVEVVCASKAEAGSRSFQAERVVCTLPLPALGQLEVRPALPTLIREAVSGLSYLPVLRIFAQMRRPYWRDESVGGPAMTDLPIGQVQQHPLMQPGGVDDRAILEAHIRGDQAAPIAKLSEPERLELLLAGLEKVHPGARNHYEGGVTKAWVDDRWSGGGFSSYAPGQITSWLSTLSRPIGRIHLAGEHTSVLRATMEGALASGVRAARDVHEALQQA